VPKPPDRSPDPTPDLESLSYEQAREELLDVVRALEAGGTTLEDSLALWERGEALAARCQAWLDGARATLDAAVAARSAGGATDGATTGTSTEATSEALPNEDED
jgi:exodeoxyribonuclease VII small subunit